MSMGNYYTTMIEEVGHEDAFKAPYARVKLWTIPAVGERVKLHTAPKKDEPGFSFEPDRIEEREPSSSFGLGSIIEYEVVEVRHEVEEQQSGTSGGSIPIFSSPHCITLRVKRVEEEPNS